MISIIDLTTGPQEGPILSLVKDEGELVLI